MNRRSFCGLLGLAPFAPSSSDTNYPVVDMQWSGGRFTTDPVNFPACFEPDIRVFVDGREVHKLYRLRTGREGFVEIEQRDCNGDIAVDWLKREVIPKRIEGFVTVTYPESMFWDL